MTSLGTAQRISIGINAIFYVGAGCLHFLQPEMYLRIVPAYLPWHRELVELSGVFEVLGGLGLLLPATRRAAAWGLVSLLIAVFPANVYMATNPVEAGAVAIPAMLRWGRLPLQGVLAWWVLWCSRSLAKQE
jgi:uncharacterized membrane protein